MCWGRWMEFIENTRWQTHDKFLTLKCVEKLLQCVKSVWKRWPLSLVETNKLREGDELNVCIFIWTFHSVHKQTLCGKFVLNSRRNCSGKADLRIGENDRCRSVNWMNYKLGRVIKCDLKFIFFKNDLDSMENGV